MDTLGNDNLSNHHIKWLDIADSSKQILKQVIAALTSKEEEGYFEDDDDPDTSKWKSIVPEYL